MNSRPLNTKQPKTIKKTTNTQPERDFFRPIISNTPELINPNHSSYIGNDDIGKREKQNIFNQNILQSDFNIDLERNWTKTNNIEPVQNAMFTSNNNYYMMNFFENNNIADNTSGFLNPVNSRLDDLKKTRTLDRNNFLTVQGGVLSNFQENKVENTRKSKAELNTNSYIPNGRNMNIPKGFI